LFLGNSYTAFSLVPFRRLATAVGKKGQWQGVVPGGARLRDHVRRGAETLISGRHWDFVVLQEQSQTPSALEPRVRSEMDAAVTELMRLTAGAGGTPMLFAHWARREGDRDNFETDTYEACRGRLDATFQRLASEQGIALVPVSAAWNEVRREHPQIVLYAADGSHPSESGAYLSACVLYAVLFGEDPATLPSLDLVPDAEGRVLRQAARRAAMREVR
jgi:hypothetical protein